MRSTVAFLAAGTIVALGCTTGSVPTELDPPFFAKGQPSPGPSDPAASWHLPANAAGLSLRSDGQYASGGVSTYVDGVCGVTARIFATTEASNSGDATISMDAGKGKNGCERRMTLVYPDNATETVRSFNNLRQLHNTTSFVPVGTTVKRTLAISPGALANNPSRCGRLLFGVGGQGNGIGSDSVLVTRLDARTWRVQSDPLSAMLAWCEANGALYTMTVDFTIVSSYDLPQ